MIESGYYPLGAEHDPKAPYNEKELLEETLTLIPKDEKLTELDGPYECPHCIGHMTLDGTYIDQVSDIIHCPYCCMELKVPNPKYKIGDVIIIEGTDKVVIEGNKIYCQATIREAFYHHGMFEWEYNMISPIGEGRILKESEIIKKL